MAYAYPGAGALDYFPCRYGNSKLLFRGPGRDLGRPYCAFLGGTATYGKFVVNPFPDLVEHVVGLASVNLGCVNAGPDVFLNEPAILDVASGARITVVQILGAQNLTNRFYAVHPRRNDRFLSASARLQAMFPEVDFTEFNFTRHMLQSLCAVSPDRFEVVAEELRAAWVARMQALLQKLSGRVLLLWMADHPPKDAGLPADLANDPILVDAEMIATVSAGDADYLEVVTSSDAGGVEGMSFSPLDRMAAAEVPGPTAHREVAAALAPRLMVMI
jgi:hypothetical protein